MGFLSEQSGIEAYLEVGHPKEFIDQFKDACAQKKQISAFGIPSKFVCTKIEYIKEGGDGPVYGLLLDTKNKSFANHAIVFSLQPLLPYKPSARNLKTSEIKNLLSVYKTSSLKEAVRNAISTTDFRVLDFNKKSSSIYILKWKHIEDEYSSNDYYLVINRNGDKFFSIGNFKGEIVDFLDVNNDGLPEVQLSIGCDGRCEAITSIYKNTKDLVYIYNH